MPMTVDLGDLTEVVDQLVQSGEYESRDAVLVDAVRALQKHEADRQAFFAELQVGMDDIEAGRTMSLEEVKAALEARRAARQASKAA